MSYRGIAFAVVLISALCGLICATATASTLLSGYGGPGAGEQVIIGSQLLNNPRGGGGTRGGAAPKLQSTTKLQSTSQGEPGSSAAGSEIHSAQTSQTMPTTPQSSATIRRPDRSPSPSQAVPSTPASQPASELGQSTQASYDLRSGLTNGELALIALIVMALLALAIGTRSLSRLQR